MTSLLGDAGAALVRGTGDSKQSLTVGKAQEDFGKLLFIYFSMLNCPPCREFTPLLCELYHEMNESEKQFEVVFCSGDSTIENYEEYLSEMPWLALPHKDPRLKNIGKTFKVKGVPRLIVLNAKNGDVIHDNAHTTIAEQGPVIIEEWISKVQ